MGRRGEEVEVARAYKGERKKFGKRVLCFVSPLFLSHDFLSPRTHVRSPMRLALQKLIQHSVCTGPKMIPGPQMLPKVDRK